MQPAFHHATPSFSTQAFRTPLPGNHTLTFSTHIAFAEAKPVVRSDNHVSGTPKNISFIISYIVDSTQPRQCVVKAKAVSTKTLSNKRYLNSCARTPIIRISLEHGDLVAVLNCKESFKGSALAVRNTHSHIFIATHKLYKRKPCPISILLDIHHTENIKLVDITCKHTSSSIMSSQNNLLASQSKMLSSSLS